MAPPVRAANGVWSRQFENAFVVANPGCSKCPQTPVEIQLPSTTGGYREVLGQDSLLQQGGTVASLKVSAASVLLKLSDHGSAS